MKTVSKYGFILLFGCICSVYTTRAQVIQYEQINLQIRKTATAPSPTFQVADAVQLVRFFMQQNGIARCESDISTHKFKLVAKPNTDLKFLLTNAKVVKNLNSMGYEIVWTSEPNMAYQTPAQKIPYPNPDYVAANTTTPTTPIYKGKSDDPPLAPTNINTSKTTKKLARENRKAQKLAAQKAASSAMKQQDNKPATMRYDEPSIPVVPSAANLKDIATPATNKPCDDCGEQNVSSELREKVLQDANYGSEAIDFGSDMSGMDSEPMDGESPQYNEAQLDSLRQLLLKDIDGTPK